MSQHESMSAAERIRQIDGLIEGLVNTKRVANSDGRDPDRVMREVARLQARIAADQAEVNRLTERQNNWQQTVDWADTRIGELRKERALLANSKTIERLVKAREAIEAMKAMGYTQAMIEELAAMLQATQPAETAPAETEAVANG